MLTLLLLLFTSLVNAQQVKWFLTTLDKKNLLSAQADVHFEAKDDPQSTVERISVNSTQRFQTMRGIGSSLEASTCFNLNRLSQERRAEIYERLFDEEKGIGLNLMRITIGTSDFCPLPFYSYDDMPQGSEDPLLRSFDTSKDEAYIVPALQEILRFSEKKVAERSNRDKLEFFASPWSGPGFMKTSDALEGGSLLSRYDESYSEYLARFVRTYRDKYKIPIIAITPQNEPLANQEYPSILLPPGHERDIITKSLGEKMQREGVEIWCFDHNWNTLFYPRTVLNDSASSAYVSGTAFHGYRGQPTAMTELHEEFPDKDIYFTEGSTFGIRGAVKIVEILRNWARSYNAWVTILDTDLQPNAGPFNPQPTMIQIDAQSPETSDVIYNFEFFMYGQFSKFIRRGAVRIASSSSAEEAVKVVQESEQIEGLEEAIEEVRRASRSKSLSVEDEQKDLHIHHIAFEDGQTTVLVVVNPFNEVREIELSDEVKFPSQVSRVTLPALSVSTFLW